jgi:hypothetical protein
VAAGATVIAPRPVQSPSLTDFETSDREIRANANAVWGAIDGKSVTDHGFGKGRVYWGMSVQSVLEAQETAPDFLHNRPNFDTEVTWIHRRAIRISTS